MRSIFRSISEKYKYLEENYPRVLGALYLSVAAIFIAGITYVASPYSTEDKGEVETVLNENGLKLLEVRGGVWDDALTKTRREIREGPGSGCLRTKFIAINPIGDTVSGTLHKMLWSGRHRIEYDSQPDPSDGNHYGF